MPSVSGTFGPSATGTPRPGFGEAYGLWLAQERNITALSTHMNNYAVVSRELKTAFEESPFWQHTLSALREADDRYAVAYKFPLISTFTPDVLIKPWDSFYEKSFRKNITQNKNFPDAPDDGWCTPPSWYSQIHDIVRTTIIVKYIDGVPIILRTLVDNAITEGLVKTSELETREDGYYGAHFNLHMECQIPTMAWEKEKRTIQFEIQVTTQIKDVIKRLLHTYYETHRLTGKRTLLSDIAWNYNDDEFVATYLGHILHFVEGMIIDARDRRMRNA